MPLVLTSSLQRLKEIFFPVTRVGEHRSPHRANGLSLLRAQVRAGAMTQVSDRLAAGGA